ncbi:diflavin oxidoreductase [Allorhizobium terrae]|uniref:assimilatory sulfite reductase (NADPH) n=1 Tax=Allorhizobium terrae TaxID=1848972 RepID=A0A4S3ZU07_9HYPH|nr:sulfite reductase flavoprotein subunit alpha [Allorhizobium terrae]THF49236.1 sulfite reductase flavoprotein subunit alpha [Allorhizobium terrae]
MGKLKVAISEDIKSKRANPGFAVKTAKRLWQLVRPSSGRPEAVSKPTVGFLYGSQTGNAENLARDAAALAESFGIKVLLAAMDEIDVEDLLGLSEVVFFLSTYGEGDMPDNAQLFWEALSGAEAPRFDGLHFGVLALGNTSYRDFCRAGKQLDARLEALGATRLLARLDCDVDFEEPAAGWTRQVLAMIAGENSVVVHPGEAAFIGHASTRHQFFNARLVERYRLSGPHSEKDIHHLEFDLKESGMTYAAGDAVGVKPVNDPDLVDTIITWLGVKPDRLINGKPLEFVLARERELRNPTAELVQAVAERARDDDLRRVWQSGDAQALGDFLHGFDVVDVLSYAPSASLSVDDLLPLLKPLTHRCYSIASSPLVVPQKVHLTIGSLRYMRGNRKYHGTCSSFLTNRLVDGTVADMFVLPNNHFRLPSDPSTPIIMVGPGTGIAPFRAFLQERRAIGAKGRNWLFFGDRNYHGDFIYRDEVLGHVRDGILTRLDLAFSRDQSEKIYVQTRMQDKGADLYDWLEQGASFYVCGDASRMARDVEKTLIEIVARHGGMSAPMAQDYVARMKREKRYLRDVY